MTNTSLLKQYIEKSGYKMSFIAQQLGLSAYGFALKVNGKSEFKGNEIAILCKLLKISARDRSAIFFAK